MNKKILAIIFAILLLLLCSCRREELVLPIGEEINPGSDAARTEKVVVQLYYGNEDQKYLVAESRVIDAAANDPMEKSVLRELFKGPERTSGEYNYLINKDTQVVQVNSGGEVLTVTLSKEFLEWPATVSEPKQKELAVYSVVNTLVEATGYAQIQLLVDRDSTGVGQRIRVEELGYREDAADSTSGMLGVLQRSAQLVLTPENTMKCILDAMLKKDYAAVYPFIAYNDAYGGTKTAEASFLTEMQATATPTLEGYTVREIIVSDDGQSATVMLDYTLRYATEDSATRTNVPTYLVKENGIWKQRYSAFCDIFPVAEVSDR